jgi:hypothetical protein
MTRPPAAEYQKCFKPDCMRKVTPASRYCCTACSAAGEAPAPYEIEPYRPGVHWIHVHSEGCEKRAAERGECDPFEADILAQRG